MLVFVILGLRWCFSFGRFCSAISFKLFLIGSFFVSKPVSLLVLVFNRYLHLLSKPFLLGSLLFSCI